MLLKNFIWPSTPISRTNYQTSPLKSIESILSFRAGCMRSRTLNLARFQLLRSRLANSKDTLYHEGRSILWVLRPSFLEFCSSKSFESLLTKHEGIVLKIMPPVNALVWSFVSYHLPNKSVKKRASAEPYLVQAAWPGLGWPSGESTNFTVVSEGLSNMDS
jgi:hypothetical protein